MSIMPPKKKSKFVNKSDQERLLQKFYDNLDNEEKDYLGNVFQNEDNADFASENISGSDSNPDDEIDMELDNNTPSVAAATDDPTPACKQIFFDLEKVVNLDNYDPCLFKNIVSWSIQVSFQKKFSSRVGNILRE